MARSSRKSRGRQGNADRPPPRDPDTFRWLIHLEQSQRSPAQRSCNRPAHAARTHLAALTREILYGHTGTSAIRLLGCFGVVVALACARSRRGSARGQCQVHRRCIAGRWRSVAWPAGCGWTGSAGIAVRLLGRSVHAGRLSAWAGSREPGAVSVRIGSIAPVSAGNPWQGRENGCAARK